MQVAWSSRVTMEWLVVPDVQQRQQHTSYKSLTIHLKKVQTCKYRTSKQSGEGRGGGKPTQTDRCAAETPRTRRMQSSRVHVSSLFKWCERHSERRQHQHLLPPPGRAGRQEGKHHTHTHITHTHTHNTHTRTYHDKRFVFSWTSSVPVMPT